MYDEQQERPPWLRNLRTRKEIEAAVAAEDVGETRTDTVTDISDRSLESSPDARGGFNRRHLLLLAFLLWMNIMVLGCLCLLGTQRVVP